jgi:aspartyl-tRNA(Asn)/glutamyl-tRNA(Gln) amidotransferase subunit C
MAVTPGDVRHVAALARIAITDERAATLVRELNGILEHMDVLASIDTQGVEPAIGVGARGLPVRGDHGPPIPLARSLDMIAPALREGFFLVPRLSTHESGE